MKDELREVRHLGHWRTGEMPAPPKHDPRERCPNRSPGLNCQCKPKCRHCKWGPHMAIHQMPEPHGHTYEPRELKP